MGALGVSHLCVLVEMVVCRRGMRLSSEDSHIERVSENIADRPAVKWISAGSADAGGVEKMCNFRAGASGQKLLIDQGYKGSLNLIRDKLSVHHLITKRRDGDHTAAFEFFLHAPADFLPQIDGVVFVHGFEKGFHENGGGIIGQRFGDGNDVNAAFPAEQGFVENTVLTAAGKTGIFPDENDVKGTGRLSGSRDHTQKSRTLGSGPSTDALIHIDMAVRQQEVMMFRIGADMRQLAGRGKFDLIISGDTDVGGCIHKRAPEKVRLLYPMLRGLTNIPLGGPDGELGASMRYLAQRYTMPYRECMATLTDIGTEESVPARWK